jgi:hypothetical protein
MCRTFISAVVTSALSIASVEQAASQAACRPKLTVTGVQFSEMIPPTLERKWTATVMVDASRCAPNSAGYFDIIFIRLKENAVDLEFREEFIWLPPSVKVGIDLWADEAVEQYWITNITPCTCRS